MTVAETHLPEAAGWKSQVGIPVRNLWLLLVYAFELAQFHERFDGLADESADLPELLAKLLCVVVERRLHKNLTRAYVPTAQVLTRVRGRIDWKKTESNMLLQRGRIACRFEDLTYDTPRNRLVRTALAAMAARVTDRALAHNCRLLARQLEELGVRLGRPTRGEMTRERLSRHDAEDRLMITVAEMALDNVLPAEAPGASSATRLEHDEALLRKIFEKAVAGICRTELHGKGGWRVRSQETLEWRARDQTDGFAKWLPTMAADVVLEQQSPAGSRRIVIETKFANALTLNAYGAERFKSGHLYQLYAYLRSQSGRGWMEADQAEGVLVYPVLDQEIDEWGTIQGHRLRVATVDLRVSAAALKQRILNVARGGEVQ